MKTVGELLVKARKSKKLTIKELSDITKIDPEHIKNLEENQYHLLPPSTFIKGFIRNIAVVLDQNPNELVAIFRRDYLSPKSTTLSPPAVSGVVRQKFQLNPRFFLVATGFLAFVLYFAFQLRAYLLPPKLDITQPLPKAVVTSPLVVEGLTDSGSIIQVNQEKPLRPDSSGYFITNISLSPMETELEITSTSRFGRVTKKSIPITIISQ